MRVIISTIIILTTICGMAVAQEQGAMQGAVQGVVQGAVQGAEAQNIVMPVRQLNNVEVIDLKNQPAVIPQWGEKNLMIFYIDPDRAGQNRDFTDYLEDTRRVEGENLLGMGVINLKDAPFMPSGLVRAIVAKRTERNGATVLSDVDRTLAEKWELGDCNNMFVVMLINRQGELLFVRKGLLSEEDKAEFLRVADILR